MRRQLCLVILLAACAPSRPPPTNELRLLAPDDGARFAPPTSLTLEVRVEVADTACPGSEQLEIVAGAFSATVPPGAVAVPFASMVTVLDAPDAEAEVTVTARLWCPGGGAALAEVSRRISVKEAVSAVDVSAAFGEGSGLLELDGRGYLFTRDDGSAVGLLSTTWALVRGVTLADAGFVLSAPDRRLFTCGPVAGDALPFCGVATGGADADECETVLGVLGADASKTWKTSWNRVASGSAEPIAMVVNAAQNLAYAVTPGKRLRALTSAGGVRWESSFSDAALNPGDVRLRIKAGGGLRSLTRVGSMLVARDFTFEGQGELPQEYPLDSAPLAFDFVGINYAWALANRSFALVNLEGEACTTELPGSDPLLPFPDGRLAVVAVAGNGSRVAALLRTGAPGGASTEHLLAIDGQCKKASRARPGRDEPFALRPGLAVTNDGRVFVVAGGMTAYTPDLQPVRETTAALHLQAPAIQCGTEVCALDASGRIVALPMAP
jgi:hypothetical protein